MIRNITRALCAASLVIAPLALVTTPAYAATSCTVNGVPRTPDAMNRITGTANSDYIVCSSIDTGVTVDGLGGNDYIVTGVVAGTVEGGTGSDYIQTNNVSSTGKVLGENESDYIRTGTNLGAVNGGSGFDVCRVSGGNPPASCEF
jgi:Ca2+-binding RTX toxin-like protein